MQEILRDPRFLRDLDLQEKIRDLSPGILEWSQMRSKEDEIDRLKQLLPRLKQLGIYSLRTGFSWAEWVMPEGEKWYSWYIPMLKSNGFDILPCFTYTPPFLSKEVIRVPLLLKITVFLLIFYQK